AGAICGAVEAASHLQTEPTGTEKPLLAASMFGNTTKLVDAARARLEQSGYEVLVFHATGSGGQTMEGLIRDGFIQGVYDVTTTEWADQLCGGVFDAGPTRLNAAGERGIPQVIAPGCLDMVNFGGKETIPARYTDDPSRKFYVWNPQVTLMRTTPAENSQLGRILAEKANAAKGPVQIFLPLRGVSILDSATEEGPQPFWWPEADQALYDAIKQHVRQDAPVHEIDANINDPAFMDATVTALLEMLK
ncbi:MAG TPA: Tm-1-like ATP-binding domain-containing protein, partial [Chloroflexota bacterium]|nr:Tm-1-like ATP-binding domain-containing protein [Chloroflexota bacterium]